MEPLPAGTLLHGRYRVVRLVGQGGMGAVYEAVDRLLENTVALKQMLHDGLESDRAFAHEAKILASLRHPALPVVIDYFAEPSGVFLVMQYIDGDDLSRLVQHPGQAARIGDVLAWADAILGALIYLHGHNPPVVHRDIKPANLRRTPRGEIVLLDFGLAKSRSQSDTTRTAERSTFGYTPRYAPPEQIDCRPTDARSDLYSLGATLYHLVAGRAPFSATERLVALNRGDPDPLVRLHLLNSSVGEAFSDVIGRALELRPDRRFASAAEMQQALRQHQSETDHERSPIAVSADSARRVDAAMPTHAELGKQADLIVQVRFANSPLLGLEDWPTRRKPPEIEQGSEPIQLVYPVDSSTGRLMPARVRIKVVAPDFVLSGNSEHLLAVPPDEYSKRLGFLLTPRHAGLCRVNVEVYDPDAFFLGSIAVESIAIGEAPASEWRIGNLVLEVVARPSAQAEADVVSTRSLGPDVRPSPAPISSAPIGPTPAGALRDLVDYAGPTVPASEIGHIARHRPAAIEAIASTRPRVWRLAVSASTVVAIVAAAVVVWRSGAPTPGVPPQVARTEVPIDRSTASQPPQDARPGPAAPSVPRPDPDSALLDTLAPRTAAAPSPILKPPNEGGGGLPTPSKSGKWVVEVFATPDETVASYFVTKLTADGFPAFLVSPVAGTPQKIFKVQVGRYKNRSDAEQVSRRISELEQLKCRVVQ